MFFCCFFFESVKNASPPKKFFIEKVNLKLGGLRQKDLDAHLCQSRNIKGKVFGYTTDNELKMHKAFENDARNGCIAHIQSKTMQKAVESVQCVSKLERN